MNLFWIGLGQAGAPMALRALRLGHNVTAHSRHPKGRPDLEAEGMRIVPGLEEARHAEIVCACLFDDAQLRDVLIVGGVLAAMAPGSVLAVHTTGSPVLARELAERAPLDVEVLDANFSGTAEMALEGGLQLMVGGSTTGLARARPVLETYADRIAHVGPAGAGQCIKMINNSLFMGQLALGLQALGLLQQQGIAPAVALDVLRGSSAGGHALNILASQPAPEAGVDALRIWLDKDADMVRQAAKEMAMDLGVLGSSMDGFGREPRRIV